MKNLIPNIITSILLASCSYNKEELPAPTPTSSNNQQPPSGPTITYTKHTKRLFDTYCITCHAPSASVSFWPLTSYNEVSVYTNTGGKIQTRVLDLGNMPPTGSISGFLTVEEKDTLQMWLDQGAPQ